MPAILNRILLYVQDVDRLAAFYRDTLGLTLVEEIPGEWAVLAAGPCQLALHRVGPAYRRPDAMTTDSNAKLVFTVDRELAALRDELIGRGVAMGEIKSFPPLTGRLCDGRDPEGNVFQLAEA
jgi:predicted enzyme related to lactoylglutathione lyase